MVQSVDDEESFLSDISALLREMNCPYQSLFNGPYEERLDTAQKKASLIFYLVGEIQTMKIIGVNNSKRQLWKRVNFLKEKIVLILNFEFDFNFIIWKL